MTELLYREEVYAIVGAAMEVYNELGPGFLEAIYQEALEVEMGMRQIPFKAQRPMVVTYKGRPLTKTYVPDLLCYDKVLVELKALERLSAIEQAQIHNYLHGTRCELGLLLNFGARDKLEYKRLVLSHGRKSSESAAAD